MSSPGEGTTRTGWTRDRERSNLWVLRLMRWISLTAGVKYTITLEYYEKGGSAVAKLQWSYPGQATQIIPASRLFH